MTDSSTLACGEVTYLALLKLDGEALDDVLASNSASLARAMRRVVNEAADRIENFAAFGNTP